MYQIGILIHVKKLNTCSRKPMRLLMYLWLYVLHTLKYIIRLLFYATYFTVRADDFDLEAMAKVQHAIRVKIDEIAAKGLDAAPKEKSLLTVLEMALEMCERGYSFQKVDLYRSHATEFIIDGDTLIPPFNAVPGLGTNAAFSIVEARKNGDFLSKEDLQQRSKVSKTIIEYLDGQGCLGDLPDQNQLSLF